jgi:hypothetical protein
MSKASNSITNKQKPVRIIPAIMMNPDGYRNKRKVYVLVEGSIDRDFVYPRLLSEKNSEIIELGGCAQVFETIDNLIKYGVEFCIGILDADFRILRGEKIPQNIFLTDYCDIEAMIFFTGSLTVAMSQWFRDLKISLPEEAYLHSTFTKSHFIEELLVLVKSFSTKIGAFRYILSQVKSNKKRSFQADIFFENAKTIEDIQKIFDYTLEDIAIILSSETEFDFDGKFVTKVRDILGKTSEYQEVHLCRGHDIEKLLFYALCLIAGKRNLFKNGFHFENGNVSRNAMQRFPLHTSYDSRYFTTTCLYASLKAWEKANPPYVLLDY